LVGPERRGFYGSLELTLGICFRFKLGLRLRFRFRFRFGFGLALGFNERFNERSNWVRVRLGEFGYPT
jgi:hypothetical protein